MNYAGLNEPLEFSLLFVHLKSIHYFCLTILSQSDNHVWQSVWRYIWYLPLSTTNETKRRAILKSCLPFTDANYNADNDDTAAYLKSLLNYFPTANLVHGGSCFFNVKIFLHEIVSWKFFFEIGFWMFCYAPHFFCNLLLFVIGCDIKRIAILNNICVLLLPLVILFQILKCFQ